MNPRRPHPSILEPGVLVLAVLLALLGAIVGMELLTRVGITPNSSILGAALAIGVGRIPLAATRRFASVERQNLLQTVISAATFGGANAVLLPAAAIWLFGRPDLVPAMLLGAALGALIDIALLVRLFGSRIFPERGLWPVGIATAECLRAGDQGGKRARLLGIGAAAGALGRSLGIPTDVIGICWIGNPVALLCFGIGLILRGHAPAWFGVDLAAHHIPHGAMIGAGAVALLQMARALAAGRGRGGGGARPRVFVAGYLSFAIAAGILAITTGIASAMTLPALAGFVAFAAAAALVSELLVGLSAMHCGWFPAFATALLFLLVGMLLGFPPLALVLLAGFISATGPAFADTGYDLKAGWILRGEGRDPDYEMEGRRRQRTAEILGLLAAAGLVLLTWRSYFAADRIPPFARVIAATIEAGSSPSLARDLILWAVPGALLQFLGGSSRQIGVLFATGLLISNPAAGWTALAALGARFAAGRRFQAWDEGARNVVAGGLIAGSALLSFASGTAAGLFRGR